MDGGRKEGNERHGREAIALSFRIANTNREKGLHRTD